ncbi:NRDE family protein [Actinomadura rugatobispora]|uniref:NRDE family protein n=1 Tax=Actinomadura rugatobispora TaxID=1994 RepID=A0ABW1A532_9ACTN|nr:NRDE family protein [Actinomadura rugatobispora]
MCTAIVSFDPSSPVPVILVGVRDEFLERSWRPPGRHWRDRPALVGGQDLRAGGTWLAADPGARRVATVLNARGPAAPEDGRRSRGELPLLAAATGGPGPLDLPRFDPFLLVGAEPGGVRLWHWDGADLDERELGPGLHMILNSGLEGEGPHAGRTEDAHMAARLGHFRPRFAAARRPEPRPVPSLDAGPSAAEPVERAWGEWLPLVNGDGLARTDPASLLPLADLGEGRIWGTSSISLLALSPEGVRYDFSASPGDPGAWTQVL